MPTLRLLARPQAEIAAAAARLAPLVAELAEKDPEAHAVIDLANPRRVIRALEVIRFTGHPYTPRFPRHTSHFDGVISFAVTREKALLNTSIYGRAEGMFASGLLEETRGLVRQGLRDAPTASRATGYAEAISVLDGLMSVEEAIEATAFATRRLAKKQGTWFRADPRLSWIDLTDGDIHRAAATIVDRVTA